MIHNIDRKICPGLPSSIHRVKTSPLLDLIAERKRLALLASLILNILVSPLNFTLLQIIHHFSEGNIKLMSHILLRLGAFSVKLVDGPGSSFRSSI